MTDMTTRERLARGLAKYDWSCETPDFEDFWRQIKDEYLPRIDDILDELMDIDFEVCAKVRDGAMQPIWDKLIGEFVTNYLTHIKAGKEVKSDDCGRPLPKHGSGP